MRIYAIPRSTISKNFSCSDKLKILESSSVFTRYSMKENAIQYNRYTEIIFVAD